MVNDFDQRNRIDDKMMVSFLESSLSVAFIDDELVSLFFFFLDFSLVFLEKKTLYFRFYLFFLNEDTELSRKLLA